MEPLYPLLAIFVAVLTFWIGAAEFVLLKIKPAAFFTWLGGWATAISITLSSSLGSTLLVAIAVVITAGYGFAIYRLHTTRVG
jgi:hypothetical protein